MMKFHLMMLTSILLTACAPLKAPEIKYDISGDGEKVLFFIHGWCINGSYWKNQVEAFKDRYRIVTVDLAGHGMSKTERNDWSFDRYADDIIDVINFLDLRNVVLIGHSMSGSIVTRVENRLPSRIAAVVGVDNFKDLGLPYDSAATQQINDLMTALKKDYQNTAVGISRGSLFSPSTDTSVIERVLTDVGNADPTVSVRSLESVLNEYQHERKFLSQLQHPLYLINSDVTPTNADSLKHYVKQGVVVKSTTGTGHYPMIENPAEFNRLLEEILASIKSNR